MRICLFLWLLLIGFASCTPKNAAPDSKVTADVADANSKKTTDFKGWQGEAAKAIDALVSKAKSVELYSLHPEPVAFQRSDQSKTVSNPKAVAFHGYQVLGSSPISNSSEQKILLESLAQGARESDGVVANCFNPRHGLRVITDVVTNDFVICFECLSVRTYTNNQSSGGFLTGGRGSLEFDMSLDDHKLNQAASPYKRR